MIAMRVDVWSDVVCPWCYVGKRRLDGALATFPHVAGVQVVHRAFQLNPAAPKGQTRSRREMLMAKYRLSDDQVRALDERMARVAAADGLDYRIGESLTGNTADAHRLLHLARGQGLESAVLDRFYGAYFVEGRSLFDASSLESAAEEAGLDEADVRRVLQSDEYAAGVREEQDRARALGVTGVPFFLVGDRYAISGAQPVHVIREIIDRAWLDIAASVGS
jgi:predicted DsbA family dithiol-disulfide isomerase